MYKKLITSVLVSNASPAPSIAEPTHLTHPFKVEGSEWRGLQRVITGRCMFKTAPDAAEYAQGQADDGSSLPVLHSVPGDTAFA